MLAGGRCVPNPRYRRAFTFFELPENQIILETVRTKCQVITVWLQVEQYSGALIDAAGQSLEAHGDLATPKILHVFGDCVGEVSIGLDPVKKLSIALTVERSRFVGDAGG